METIIKKLRINIDKIDADIIKKLAQRKKISEKIGAIKAKSESKIIDKKREQKQKLNYEKLAKKYKINPIFIKKLFKTIIRNSRSLQKL